MKIKGRTFRMRDLLENNKIVFLFSLVIAFFVWAGVAMYASPDESYTVNDIPIVIDMDNEIIKDSDFEVFNQSAERFNVTVTGPRYLITSLSPEDFTVNVPLNNVTGAGLFTLNVRASLTNQSRDIAISSQSLSTIQAYFDTRSEKTFDININDSDFSDHIADGFSYMGYELPVTSVIATGPTTQIEKIVRCSGSAEFGSSILRSSGSVPITLGFEGKTAAETVNINNYVSVDNSENYYTYVRIAQRKTLTAVVEITGGDDDRSDVTVTPETAEMLVDTANEEAMTYSEFVILTVPRQNLVAGDNTFTVQASQVRLPEGLSFADDDATFTVSVYYDGSGITEE